MWRRAFVGEDYGLLNLIRPKMCTILSLETLKYGPQLVFEARLALKKSSRLATVLFSTFNIIYLHKFEILFSLLLFTQSTPSPSNIVSQRTVNKKYKQFWINYCLLDFRQISVISFTYLQKIIFKWDLNTL